MGTFDELYAQLINASKNPFTGETDSDPFYVQAYKNYPNYQGPITLGADYQSKWTNVNGGDTWEKNMLAKQGLESQAAMDKMNAANASNWATARSNMAMRGGIDAGAKERLASNAAKTGIMNTQNQAAQDQIARLGIGAQAEDKRIDLEKYNNEGTLNNNRWNITNALNEGTKKNAYNIAKYDTMMQGYAADRSANATENAGKK